MREFGLRNKTFIKSNNKSNLLIIRYLYALIVFIILTIGIYLLTDNNYKILPLCKTIGIGIVSAIIIDYIANIIFKNNNFMDVIKRDNVIYIAIIVGLFSYNLKIPFVILGVFVSIMVKKVYKGLNLSAPLYGLLVIIIYKYLVGDVSTIIANIGNFIKADELGKIKDLLLGIDYLSPLLSIMAFVYLFHKKSIKYGIVVAYILTFSVIMFLYGIFNDKVWFLLMQLLSSNILFFTVFTLSDYMITPTLVESQIIYGVILAIISAILWFVAPEFSILIPFILGPILLTKVLEKSSPKLKYNKKIYYMILGIMIMITIITTIGLIIIF